MTHRLDIANLACARGDRPLFEGLSQSIRSTELLHVVGSNGSGKTTLLRTMAGLSLPMEGQIRWDGKPARELGDEYREHLAYVGHLDGIQGELTAVENLRFQLCLADSRSRIESVLKSLGLSSHRHLPAKVLSQGQRRRLALARLLLLNRPLWILDEPLTALDVKSCELMMQVFERHLEAGGLIVLSSHQEFRLSGSVRRLSLEPTAKSPIAHSSAGRVMDHHAT